MVYDFILFNMHRAISFDLVKISRIISCRLPFSTRSLSGSHVIRRLRHGRRYVGVKRGMRRHTLRLIVVLFAMHGVSLRGRVVLSMYTGVGRLSDSGSCGDGRAVAHLRGILEIVRISLGFRILGQIVGFGLQIRILSRRRLVMVMVLGTDHFVVVLGAGHLVMVLGDLVALCLGVASGRLVCRFVRMIGGGILGDLVDPHRSSQVVSAGLRLVVDRRSFVRLHAGIRVQAGVGAIRGTGRGVEGGPWRRKSTPVHNDAHLIVRLRLPATWLVLRTVPYCV